MQRTPCAKRWPVTLLLAFVMLALLSGCALRSPPTQLYALYQGRTPPPEQQRALSLGVGPIELPNILERPQIVTRRTDNQVEFSELHQWAGRLEEDIGHALAARLMARLGTRRVYTYPWPGRLHPDYQIRVRFSRFDGSLGGALWLDAQWEILPREKEKHVWIDRIHRQIPVEGGDYADYVHAMHQAIEQLADQVAQRLFTLPLPKVENRQDNPS